MKLKLLKMFSLFVLFSFGTLSPALAQNVGVTGVADIDAGAKVQVKTVGNATSASAKAEVRGNATSSVKDDGREDEDKNNNGTSTDENSSGGSDMAEAHRSAVASFVKSLLSVAGREGGIGEQVRVIAKAQNDSASTSVEAISKVENRGKLKSFFFGTDYKSLGQLRSDMVTTQNNIDQLKTLLDKTVSLTDKAELQAQINVLADSQVKIEAFINDHESSFSLLGWLVKPFTE